ncbi:MAG: penicillin acylase family protein [Rhodospirillales bacterium]|nr:penicillin acylase family protein [Rhodospirillales bacterium]
MSFLRRTVRRTVRVLALLAVLAVLGLGALFLWLRQATPQLDGTIVLAGGVAGLAGEVEILRDGHGIPHIHAQSINDAYFGLGFAHAQDRMFQMEQQRRLSQGRLSEVLGPLTAEVDRFMRLLDLHSAAQASVTALDMSARESFNAYAAGVNAYMASHKGPLAPEFAILMADRPEPWTAADSVAWLKVMALHLSGNWRSEALRAAMIARIGPEKTASFFPDVPADAPTIINDATGVEPEAAAMLLNRLLPAGSHGLNGSNSWVVDGRHTASGRPLLANDPHLGFSIPAIWYLAHLEAPGLAVAGATLPGLPLVIVGTNGRIAWGVTNTGPDTQDLYIERLDPERPGHYLTPEGSEPFAVREETIVVRFAGDDRISMLETRHGPILTGVRGEATGLTGEGEALALSWTMLQDDDRSVEAGLALHVARDWDDFVASGRRYAGPMQNIVYGDRRGNIGLLAPAIVPVRKSGEGLVPMPGWTGEADWIGQIPHDDLPRLLNPETGAIVTANHRLVGDDYPYFISHEWQPGYRARRIADLIGRSDSHSVESFAAIQRDTTSLFAEAAIPIALAGEPQTEAGRRLQAALIGWDGAMDPALIAPTVFHAWYRAFTRAIYEDDLGTLFPDAWQFRPSFVLSLGEGDPHGWCANSETGAATTCGDLAGMAFDDAARFLNERFGEDSGQWLWGEVHALTLRHRLFGLIPVLRDLTGVRIPLGGDRFTVATASHAFNDDERAFTALHGPVLRAVIDLDEPVTGFFAVLPGQSANPFSPYYDNMVEPWLANRPIAIPLGRDHIDAAHRLVLQPGVP